MIKRIFRKIFRLSGLDLVRYRPVVTPTYDYVRNEEMIAGLSRAKSRGLNPVTIVDVGAAEGSWSLSAQELWPNANYVLFEPLEERAECLEALTRKNDKFHFVAAAAGENRSQKSLYVSGDLDGSAIVDSTEPSENTRLVNITSIDDEMSRLNVKGPYIVKLDTHGFEVPILKGATATLQNAELLIIEVYGFNLTSDSLLFYQMTSFVEQFGFRLVDMVDVMRRNKDGAFWQADAFYMKKDHPLFKDNAYN